MYIYIYVHFRRYNHVASTHLCWKVFGQFSSDLWISSVQLTVHTQVVILYIVEILWRLVTKYNYTYKHTCIHAYIYTHSKKGVYYPGCSHETGIIKMGVVSSFVQWQQRVAEWFDGVYSCTSTRTQHQTCVLAAWHVLYTRLFWPKCMHLTRR